jgi:hypothetical protein
MKSGSIILTTTTGHNGHPSRTAAPIEISSLQINTAVPSPDSSNIPLFITYAPFGFISACPTFSHGDPVWDAMSPTSSLAVNPTPTLPPVSDRMYPTPTLDPSPEELKGKTLITLLFEHYDYRTMYNLPSLADQIYFYLPFILQSSLGINGTLITQDHPTAFLLTPVECS